MASAKGKPHDCADECCRSLVFPVPGSNIQERGMQLAAGRSEAVANHLKDAPPSRDHGYQACACHEPVVEETARGPGRTETRVDNELRSRAKSYARVGGWRGAFVDVDEVPR